MKLLRIGPAGHERPAVLTDDGTLLDATSVAPDGYDGGFWSTGGTDRLRAGIEGGTLPAVTDPGARVGAPIPRPGKIVCIGLNYRDHAEEAGMALPAEPVVFLKAPDTVVGPHDNVLIPIGGDKTDWEVELGIVIGHRARYLADEAAALEVIAGYCVSNDVSEREWQLERGGQWTKGKSCETFNPLGPWLVTPDEVGDVGRLDMWLDIDGERMQTSNTANLVFSVPHIVWYLSQFMVLEPGDLINTGTPGGVGLAMSPQRFLRDGEVMELSVEGLGTQRQVCRQATR